MDKPLEETTIEMPTKPLSSLSETDNEPAASPQLAVEPDAPDLGIKAAKLVVELVSPELVVELASTELVVEPVVLGLVTSEQTSSELLACNVLESPNLELLVSVLASSEQVAPKVVNLEVESPELMKTDSPSSHADSLSHLLPVNTFAQISPRCYIFAGAEVTLENLEADSEDSEDDFSDEDEEDENETSSLNANEIIVPDIENVLSNEVPVPEISPTPTTSSALSPTPSTSQLQCNDQEIVENISDIQADDANEDLEPAPIKRPRLATDGETVF